MNKHTGKYMWFTTGGLHLNGYTFSSEQRLFILTIQIAN